MISMVSEKPDPGGDFGPWDLYELVDDALELQETYYYREDIPEEFKNSEKHRIVKLGQSPE